MAAEGTGGGELAQLVANHILSHIDGNVLAAVMHGKGVSDEGGEDGGGAAPGLQDLLLAGLIHFVDPLQQLGGAKGAFLDTSAHLLLPPLLRVAVLHDELLGAVLALAGLVAHGGLAPRSHRAGTANRALALAAAVGVVVVI